MYFIPSDNSITYWFVFIYQYVVFVKNKSKTMKKIILMMGICFSLTGISQNDNRVIETKKTIIIISPDMDVPPINPQERICGAGAAYSSGGCAYCHINCSSGGDYMVEVCPGGTSVFGIGRLSNSNAENDLPVKMPISVHYKIKVGEIITDIPESIQFKKDNQRTRVNFELKEESKYEGADYTIIYKPGSYTIIKENLLTMVKIIK